MIYIIFKYIFNNVIVQVIVLVWPSSHGTSAMASSLLRWSRNSTSSWRACAATGHVDHFLSLPNFLGISMDFTRSFANWSQLTREQVLKVGAPGQMHQPASLLFDTCAANGLCSSSDAQARPFLSLQRRTTGPQAHVLRLKLRINEGKLPLNVSKPISCWDVKRPAIPPAAASTLHGSALASSSAWKIALQIWRGLAWTILIYFAKVNPWNNDLTNIELWWNKSESVMNHFSFDWDPLVDPLVSSIGPLPQLLSQLGKLIVRLLRLGSRLAQWDPASMGIHITNVTHSKCQRINCPKLFKKNTVYGIIYIIIYIYIWIPLKNS